MATPADTCERRRAPLRLCSWFAARPALHAFSWRIDGASPGTRTPRESLTQDSRSAVKARLFDPLRESFGDERCTRRGRRRDGLAPRPSRGFEPAVTWRDALENRANRGMRAYVTSGDPLVTTRAKRDACALRPHATSCGASSRLAAHERREGLRAARTAWRRRFSGRAR